MLCFDQLICRMTFLFRTEIDLKGHRLAQHSGALSKVDNFLLFHIRA